MRGRRCGLRFRGGACFSMIESSPRARVLRVPLPLRARVPRVPLPLRARAPSSPSCSPSSSRIFYSVDIILYMQRAREPRGRRPWAREPRGRRPILPARAERRHPVRARGDPPRVRRQHHLHARALQVLQQEHSTGRTTPSFSTCSRRTTATHALISLRCNSPGMPATSA